MIYDSIYFLIDSNYNVYDTFTEKEYKIISVNKHQVTLCPIGTNKKKYFGLDTFYKRFTASKLEIRRLKILKILEDDCD